MWISNLQESVNPAALHPALGDWLRDLSGSTVQ